jgi:hypothetical protein
MVAPVRSVGVSGEWVIESGEERRVESRVDG